MARRQPFTVLCRALATRYPSGRADLHTHTTCSDGAYTPSQVVELARRSGLSAVALTDHDTTAGLAEAMVAAAGVVEVVPGVELTARHGGAIVHILGYFFRPDDAGLAAALRALCAARGGRFLEMVERLRGCGVSLQEDEVRAGAGAAVPGRRQLAQLLVKAGQASSLRHAFQRYLGDGSRVFVPAPALPAGEAVALVRAAGGVAAWAHPPYDEETRRKLGELRDLGLGAVEVDYPALPSRKQRALRAMAAELGLAVSGGSDCHGPDPARRTVGSGGVTAEELEALRQRASERDAQARV
jgi:predicted metal-dependent phosphoesterase TrpH